MTFQEKCKNLRGVAKVQQNDLRRGAYLPSKSGHVGKSAIKKFTIKYLS
jgi:hypothetical protein